MNQHNDQAAIFRQINYLYRMVDEVEKDKDLNKASLLLIKTIISNLWELKKEKYGGRPVYDLMVLMAAEKGGVNLINGQIDYMEKMVPLFAALMKGEIEEVEAIISSLKELKQYKS